MLKSRIAAVALSALVAVSTVAYAAGYFPGFPIVGGASYCSSVSGVGNTAGTGQPSISGQPGQFGQGFPNNASGSTGNFAAVCNDAVNAGPATVTGMELIPADTQLGQGQQPQTVLIPSILTGSTNVRTNRLIGGDFNTNLWQRGTTFSALTPSTPVMTADRWALYSSGNTVTVSKQTAAADTLPAQGFYASMRVSRPSTTNTSQICVGQVLDKTAANNLIGNNAVFSFYAMAGAGLNAVASNNITATIAYYTAADSATPFTNTSTFMQGTTTGYTAVAAGASVGTTATVASGVATINLSTTALTRYSVYGKIPATNAAGTAVTGAGVTLCYTPASGTGGSTEWFEFEAAQLQAMPSTATAALPNGVTAPTGFDRRNAALESVYQLYYSQVLTDGAATIRYGLGQVTTTTNANIVLALEPMRITPVTTIGTTTSFAVTIAAGTAAACSTLAAVATSNTTSSAVLACTTSGVVAGNATQFIGAATGGLLTFSAEP